MATSFAFQKSEGNVGEPLQSQLVVRSCAHEGSAPICLTEVKIVFEGSLRPIRLLADQDAEFEPNAACEILSVSLRDSANFDQSTLQSPSGGLASLIGTTNLSFSPSQMKAFDLIVVPREAGEARVASITLMVEEEKFDIAYVVTDQDQNEPVW